MDIEVEDDSWSGFMSATARDRADFAQRVARGEAEPNLIDHPTYFTNLPREYYTSQAIFDTELDKVFSRQWLYAGHVSDIPNPGDYYVRQIGPESLIIARDLDGQVRAYFNMCTHRGSRLCQNDTSGNAKQFICPYHRWSFGIDGKLKVAPGARNGREFDFAEWGLQEAECGVEFSLIFVWLGRDTPDETVSDFLINRTSNMAKMALVEPTRTKVAARRVYDMKCNWKVMMENFGECYHCIGGHPTLSAAVNIPASFLTDEGKTHPETSAESLFTFKSHAKTISGDGDWVCDKRLGTPQPEQFSEGFVAFPLFVGATYHADYAVVMGLEPVSLGESRMYTEWLVHEDAVEGVDYDVDRLIEGWHKTNQEDVFLSENNYRGLQSRRFKPGPHVVNREVAVHTALIAYLEKMSAPDA